MKFSISLIAIFTSLVFSQIQPVDSILVDRIEDGQSYLGLPSWDVFEDSVTVAHNSEGTVIQLPNTHEIDYMSNTYTALTVYPNGQISLGVITPELDKSLEPYVLPVQGVDNVGSAFSWNALVDSLQNKYIAIHFSHFLKSGKYYSVQVSLYTDGEIQVQLWQDDQNTLNLNPEQWMNPLIYDGTNLTEFKRRRITSYTLYGKEGLRPGLIAKSFRGSGVHFSEPYGIGGGLHVDMGSYDGGGMIGFDYSREHPVVGGIGRVVVEMKDPIVGKKDLFIWHFLQFEGTYFATYPYAAPGQKSFIGLAEQYLDKDDKPILSHPFHPADGFRFQIVYSDPGYAFTIASISYGLKQLPLVQFRAPKPFYLNFSVVGSGRVAMNYPEEASPIALFKGQKASASIVSKPGSSIKSITINGEVVFGPVEKKNNQEEQSNPIASSVSRFMSELIAQENERVADILNSLLGEKTNSSKNFSYRSLVSPASDLPYTRMNFNVESMSEDLLVEIEFEPCGGRKLPYVVPNMVITESFLDPQSNLSARKMASASISNAFGKVVQTQDSLNVGEYVVNSTYRDGLGNVRFRPLSFVRDTSAFGYLDMACEACIDSANGYYNGFDAFDRPNALGYAYVERLAKYGNQEGSFGQTFGIAGGAFEYEPEQAESWGFPASSKEDFLKRAYLNAKKMSEIYKNRLANPGPYHLTITKDNEGRYTQEISDEKGRKVSTWSYDGVNEMITINEYDEFDRLVKTYIKGNEDFHVAFIYDAMGRKVKEYTKDKDTTYYAYDSLGRLKFTQTAAQKEKGYISVNLYNEDNRISATGELTSGYTFADVNLSVYSNFVPSVRTFYGIPSMDSLQKYGVQVNSALFSDIVGKIENVRDNDVGAIVAYDSKGVALSVKFSSLDRSGKKTCQWIVYPFAQVPAVQLTYAYNSADELVESKFMEWNGSSWIEINKRNRHYDHKGRLDTIRENGKLLATYIYSHKGNVVEKNYYDNGQLVYTKRISRDVYGRPTKVEYVNGKKVLYSDSVTFTSPLVSRTTSAKHSWGSLSGFPSGIVRANQYEYDYSGRLISVSGDSNSTYGYDKFGRMERKLEGSSAVAYAYNEPGSYRATGYAVSGRNFTPTYQYFEYDASGNIWLDRYHKVAYEFDSRGLPEKVRRFSSIPSSISLTNMDAGISSGEQVAELHMAYDETGNRIWFDVDSANSGFSEVTFPGVGIYTLDKAAPNSSLFTLDREVLVAGGYRKGGVAYYPMTDVQGNVRGYATTSGINSAYDYFPYGSVINLAVNNMDGRDRWQGKEYDGEHGKYFFGSRFFDPLFALWMSPDPAGQFANPYTYGGDPLNYVDPNGESVTAAIAIGAAVGAAIGASISAVQCSGANEQSCGRAMAQGAAIGAVAGAASGGVGSAVGGAVGGGVAGAIVGGAAGGATSGVVNYIGNSLVYGTSADGMGLWTAVWQGALGGAVSGGVGYGLGALGTSSLAGDWFIEGSIIPNPATVFGNVPIFNQAVSSAFGSMSVAAVNAAMGEEEWDEVGTAALTGMAIGMGSSVFTSAASLALIHITYKVGGTEAVNKMFDGGDGVWMTEGEAIGEMSADGNFGSVSGSVADTPIGWLISILSGGGPLSHVRGSDAEGRVMENNGSGVKDYFATTNKDEQHFNRLTYVTKKYVGKQDPNWTTNNMRGYSYGRAGLCTGATHMINPAYKGGAPNNLLPWQYRHSYYVNVW